MATLRYRSGSWNLYWRRGGRTGPTESTTWDDDKVAQRAKKLIEAHLHQLTGADVYHRILGVPLPHAIERPACPTVAEWADSWLASRTRITPGVRGRYRRQLDTEILPVIGDLRIDDVTGTHVAQLLQKLGETRKANTVTRYYAVVHSVFGWAVKEGKLPSNPARRTDFVRDLIDHDDLGEEDHVYLSRPEFGLIYDNAWPYARPLLRFLVDTGTRFHEATACDVADVRLLGKSPNVRIAKAWKQDEHGGWYRGSTKGRNKRTVTIPRSLAEELVSVVANQPGDELLFRAPLGGRVIYSNFRSRHWLPTLAAAGRCVAHPPLEQDGESAADRLATSTCACPTRLRRDPSLHDLRHTHVAWLIALNRPMAYISRRIGHHATTITEKVYAGILPEVDEGAMAAYDEAATAAAGGHAGASASRAPAAALS